MIAYPRIIIALAINCPRAVIGAISPYPTVVSVTIAQYTLLGMLVNPFSAPSIMYIIVPKMIQRINTNNKKTAIFALLDLSANNSLFEAPMYRVIFNILNIRNNRKALKTARL